MITCRVNTIKKEQDITKAYLQESDYYFSGNIIEDYYFSGKYYRCIIVKPDSIYLGNTSHSGYMAAYNNELNEIALFTGYSTDKSLGGIIPSYVAVDSKRDTILFDKFQGTPMTGLVPIKLLTTRERFEDVLRKRGGSWIRF